jgi:beta-barrel assembly-enhancing protease
MKRILALAAILSIGAAALYMAERRQHHDAVSPDAVLDVAADLQRDVTRAPMQLTRLSDAEETRIGDTLAEQYLHRIPALTPQMQTAESYVTMVGDRVAAHARRRLNYRFHLIPDPNFINAFAIPGGHVFIGQGLINQMTAEDELAFVLGHEIEHIDHYHAAERVQTEARLHRLDLGYVAAIVQIPMSLWQAGYTKDEEFEADREGLRLAAADGYSPEGAVLMLDHFEVLDREFVVHSATPAGELSQVAVEGLEGYFRSHPETSERLAQVQRIITEDPLPTGTPLTHLRKISPSHENAPS